MPVRDDTITNHQPQAGAFADAFRRKKRFKQPRFDVGRNAAPIILDFHEDLTVILTRSHPDMTALLNGIDRIIEKIGPHLIEFDTIRRDARQGTVIFANHRRILQFMPQHRERALNPLMDVDILQRGTSLKGIRFHGFHQSGNATRAAIDFLQQGPNGEAGSQPCDRRRSFGWG